MIAQKVLSLLFAQAWIILPAAYAEIAANGSILEYEGAAGELIVSRDGVVYHLSAGDPIFDDDILRARNDDTTTIIYNGCEMKLPGNRDVVMDGDFCSAAVSDQMSMAEIASVEASTGDSAGVVAGMNSPLMIGGSVLSLGGLVDAINGGDGGTGSTASIAAGAAQASVDP